jgi:hypothetical protein
MKIGTPKKGEPVPPSPEDIDYFVNVWGLPELDVFYHCPCCRYPTLATRGSFDVCAVCFWEDDGQDNHDADRVRGGPNGNFSLTQAIANFEAYGACEEAMISRVRAPTQIEMSYRKNVA